MTLPGDVRPPLLAQPPGDRYRTVGPIPVMERPRLARGLLLGLVTAVVVAVLSALLRGILDVTVGALGIAVAGGWLIGAAVRRGAWDGQPHRPSSAPVVIGGALGAVCWLAGLVGAWMVAMAILPASSRSFADRLAANPFPDWLVPQLGLVDYLALILSLLFGAVGARSAATRD